MPPKAQSANRRGFLKLAGATALAKPALARGTTWGGAPPPTATPGLPPLKITDVRVIVTCPDRNYVLVKILTSEPGLYGEATPRSTDVNWPWRRRWKSTLHRC